MRHATQPPRLRMHNLRLVYLSRPTLDELIAALDIQDAPFVPPRFEPWRLMERIIANCAAVCIWVGGACGAHALRGIFTCSDGRKRRCLRVSSCSLVRTARLQARNPQR